MRPARSLRAPVAGIIAGLVVLLVGIWLGGHPGVLPSLLRGGLFESHRTEPVTEQALDILTSRYYRPLERSSLVDVGLSGIVASLDDPYSHYIDPESYRKRNEPPNQDQGGIGITTAAEPGGLRVLGVVENSPASHAGLMSGDLIVKVGSTSLVDRSENLAGDLIRGPIGTRVELTFRRDDTEHVISLERAKIVAPVTSWHIRTYDHLRIGHLTLTGFTEGSGDKLRTEVRAALDAGAQALILDLRGNGGGLISEAINVASTFIPSGEIMSAEERGRPRRVYMAPG